MNGKLTTADNIMICIILVAGHDTNLNEEIKNDSSGQFRHLEGTPKALLPGVGGKRILDYWWDLIKNRQLFSQVFLICNADKFKYYEQCGLHRLNFLHAVFFIRNAL